MTAINNTSSYDVSTLEAAKASFVTLQTQLPVRPALTSAQRSKLAVVGDKTRPFLTDALDAIQSNPEIVPRSVDLAELAGKSEAHDNLMRLEASAAQFLENVRDVRMQLGNELYQVMLAVYALMGKPVVGASMKPRLEVLQRRFKKYGQRKENPVAVPGAET